MSKKKNNKKNVLISGSFKKEKISNDSKDRSKKTTDPMRTKKIAKKSKISLDKSERKAAKKTLGSTPKIPKDLAEIRKKCNHQCGSLTSKEYVDKGLNIFMVPMLGEFERVFGDAVKICETCGDVYVDGAAITPEQLLNSTMMLYGAINAYMASGSDDVKKKDIKSLNDLKNVVLKDVLEFVEEYRENYPEILSNDNFNETNNNNRPNGNTYTV